jgi:fermentation-respiration switch protein FrsA (DUF1100 family)
VHCTRFSRRGDDQAHSEAVVFLGRDPRTRDERPSREAAHTARRHSRLVDETPQVLGGTNSRYPPLDSLSKPHSEASFYHHRPAILQTREVAPNAKLALVMGEPLKPPPIEFQFRNSSNTRNILAVAGRDCDTVSFMQVVRAFATIIFWGALSLGMSGCSHLLYYPKKVAFTYPGAFKGVKPQDVEIPTPDGSKLHAWYFKTNKRKRAKATLLFFHGNAENLTTHFSTLYWILEYGYDFVIFDYRGYGKTEGQPNPENTVKDGVTFLRWAKKRFRSSPLVVFAQSLGGAIALRSVVETGDEIPLRLVVVDSTFYSYQEIGRTILARTWLLWPFQWLSYLVLSDRWAPGRRIDQISPVPLVIMHGTNDSIVDYGFGRRIHELAEEPKEFWHVEGGYHTDALWKHDGQFRRMLLGKLEEVITDPVPVREPKKPKD